MSTELGYLEEEMGGEIEGYVAALFNTDVEEREGFQSGIWSKDEYGDPNAYEEADKFLELIDHLKLNGGEDVVQGNPDILLKLLLPFISPNPYFEYGYS